MEEYSIENKVVLQNNWILLKKVRTISLLMPLF
jgi:hypothetical protein